MTFKMSSKAQTIKIFNLRSDTNEFIGVGDAYIAQHTELPSHSTDSEPPEIPSGQIAAFEFKKSCMESHRKPPEPDGIQNGYQRGILYPGTGSVARKCHISFTRW